jgi:hypothetical protein
MGLSLSGLETLYRGANGRSTRQMWAEVWLNDIQPDGWTAEVVWAAEGVWLRDIFTNTATGDQLIKTPENALEFRPPPGAKSLLDTSANKALDLSGALGTATHYMSYSWEIPCHDMVEAIKLALQHETRDCYVWFDLLHMDYWNVRTGGDVMQGLDLLQVCSKWDEPERLKRAWIMYEAFCAVVRGSRIILGMIPSKAPPDGQCTA